MCLPGEPTQVDPVPGAAELELEAVMGETLLVQAGGHAQFVQQLDGPVLEDARAHPALDVLPAAGLEHDRVDPLQVEEVREHESRRAGADDCNLGTTRAVGSSASTSCAIANAELAAGAPQ